MSSHQCSDATGVGPLSQDNSRQAQSGGYDASPFFIDRQTQLAICPLGKTSVKWTTRTHREAAALFPLRFGLQDCLQCPVRAQWTRSPHSPPGLTLRPHQQWEALQQARLRQHTPAFERQDAQRAGIEETHSQAVRAPGLPRTRSVGLLAPALSHAFTAAAINVIRLDAFLEGKNGSRASLPWLLLLSLVTGFANGIKNLRRFPFKKRI